MITPERFIEIIRIGDATVVQEAIDKGAGVNTSTQVDGAPLLVAADCGHERIVALLLKAGARADIVCLGGFGLVDFAFKEPIKTMLRQAGAFHRRDVEKGFEPQARGGNPRHERELERVRRSHARARR